MESQAVQGFAPSEIEKELIQKHLGSEGVIVDSNFKGNVILKETQARRRAEQIIINCVLHSYVDKNDEKQYLYTQFEAFHCFRVFPCFDQPNLKAKMTFSITVTKDWVTVSNEKEKRYDDAQGNGKRVFERFGTEWFLKFYDNQQFT